MPGKQMELMINEPKAVDGIVSIKENQYVYRRRWGSITKTTTPPEGGSDEEYEEEEVPSGVSLKLKERLLVHGRNRKVKHAIHRHSLLSYKILKEDKVVCTVCEIYIIGLAYRCDQDCDFLIHKSCLNTLATLTNHWSHRDHELTLRASPDTYANRMFGCNACWDMGEGYHYHCSTCGYDLHVACAGIPQRVHCYLHRYPLTLFTDKPIENKNTINCNICQDVILLKGWIYYNKDSEFAAHLSCALTVVMIEEESSPKESSSDVVVTDGSNNPKSTPKGGGTLVDSGIEEKEGEEEKKVDVESEVTKEDRKEKEAKEEEDVELGNGGRKKPSAGKKSSSHEAITGSNPKKTPKPASNLVDDGVKEKEGDEKKEEEPKEKAELGSGGRKKPTAGKKTSSQEAIKGSKPKKTPKPVSQLVDDTVKEKERDVEKEGEEEEMVELGSGGRKKPTAGKKSSSHEVITGSKPKKTPKQLVDDGVKEKGGEEEKKGKEEEEMVELRCGGRKMPTAGKKNSSHEVIKGSKPKKTPKQLVDDGVKEKEGEEEKEGKEEEMVELRCGGRKMPTAGKKNSSHEAIKGSMPKKTPKPECKLVDDGVKEKGGEEEEGVDEYEEEEKVELVSSIQEKQTAVNKSSFHIVMITGSNPKKTPKPRRELVDGGIEENEGKEEEDMKDKDKEKEEGKEEVEEEEEKVELGCGCRDKPTAVKESSSHEAITSSNPKKTPRPGCQLVDDGAKEEDGVDHEDLDEDENGVKEEGEEKEVPDVKICKICGSHCYYNDVGM